MYSRIYPVLRYFNRLLSTFGTSPYLICPQPEALVFNGVKGWVKMGHEIGMAQKAASFCMRGGYEIDTGGVVRRLG